MGLQGRERGRGGSSGGRNQAEKLIAGTEALGAWSEGRSNVINQNGGLQRGMRAEQSFLQA